MGERVKDRVRDVVEQKVDTLHKIADVVTFPLAPVDGAIHGVARGLLNWLTDAHPDEDKPKPESKPSSNTYAPPPPPPYQGYPTLPAPGYAPPSQYANCYPTPPPPSSHYSLPSLPTPASAYGPRAY
ncbi:arp2/3 complex-activating protein rickA [Ricinus communis]|uniref:Uncharacterized protein n=1 Tax=Ricinus communis TaxID=3988 RepID=B9S205_RICCO|nr:arp2/3 complex-activating protein rickA [Ricinus communis]EEF42348.1 conserved hypothetical protein [Ricinus communis]|eukprot:XP_002520024.1 uncharacterized protein LOC8280459 [Ricinus communis]